MSGKLDAGHGHGFAAGLADVVAALLRAFAEADWDMTRHGPRRPAGRAH